MPTYTCFRRDPQTVDPLRIESGQNLAGPFLVPSFCPYVLSILQAAYVAECSSFRSYLKSANFLHPRQGLLNLFDALVANLVAMMCDADVCSWITTTRFNREFKWDVKQAPREAPDSDC